MLAWRERGRFGAPDVRRRVHARAPRRAGAARPRRLGRASARDSLGQRRDHLVLSLAAQYAGVLLRAGVARLLARVAGLRTLRHVARVLTPGLVYARDARLRGAQLDRLARGMEDDRRRATWRLLDDAADEPLDRAHAAIDPTRPPRSCSRRDRWACRRASINTHRMLAANQQMILEMLPFLGEEPPVLVDWLPWHHTFGGNHNIGIVIYNGGSLYIDDGRPVPGQFDETRPQPARGRPDRLFQRASRLRGARASAGARRALAERFFSRACACSFTPPRACRSTSRTSSRASRSRPAASG